MAVVQVWAAVLITYGVSTGIAQTLDMALTSVDDMYEECSEKMNSQVNNYLQNELNMDNNFKKAWNRAQTKYQNPLFKAIYVYTLESPNIYGNFNKAVRTQKSQYKTGFRYHALHFFLTTAIQTLKKKGCLTTYRRVNISFRQVVANKEFRFGSFTSSSEGEFPSTRFGTLSCFNITTCFGAGIGTYSALGNHEREVLIPPYEVFKVTNIIDGTEANKQSCEVIYKVKSKGTKSNLNCSLFPKRGIRKMHN